MARSGALLNVLNLVNAEVEELPIEQQFLNDLKASIELQDQKSGYKPSQTYKPSSMNCIRNMYFQITGAEQEGSRASSELVGICESGIDRHNRIQDAVASMVENGIDCEYCDVGEYVSTHNLPDIEIKSKQGNETKLYNKELNISFLCDGIIRYKGKYYILEIKTETANKFWDRKGVNPDHYLQGTAYSLSLGLDDVIFLYECRDTCIKKTFMFNVTEDMRENLRNKILTCDEYANRNEVPPKPQEASKKMCAYCSYAKLCERS